MLHGAFRKLIVVFNWNIIQEVVKLFPVNFGLETKFCTATTTMARRIPIDI